MPARTVFLAVVLALSVTAVVAPAAQAAPPDPQCIMAPCGGGPLEKVDWAVCLVLSKAGLQCFD